MLSSLWPLFRKGLPPELIQGARLFSFVLLVFLAMRVARSRDPLRRRRRIQILLGYLLTVNAAVVLVRTDDWPFSPYPMMAVDATDRTTVHSMIAFRAVDGLGREWRVDPLAWSPLFPQAIMGWFENVYPFASNAQRDEVGRFLLARAEGARVRHVRGLRVGNERWLGPLAAPDTNLYWPPPEGATEPFVRLRVYRLFWRSTELAADPARFGRKLLLECSAP
jgi:hypothetical protein